MLLGISTIAVYWPNLYELSLLQKDKHILFPEYNNTEEYPYEKIKNWGGLYNEDGEIILRFQKDNYGIIDTLVHEFGHRFDDKLLTKAYREPLEMHYTDMKNSSTGVFITDYAKKNFKEYFAENFAEYTLNPDKLKEVDEFVYTLFNKMSKNTRNNYFNN